MEGMLWVFFSKVSKTKRRLGEVRVAKGVVPVQKYTDFSGGNFSNESRGYGRSGVRTNHDIVIFGDV